MGCLKRGSLLLGGGWVGVGPLYASIFSPVRPQIRICSVVPLGPLFSKYLLFLEDTIAYFFPVSFKKLSLGRTSVEAV